MAPMGTATLMGTSPIVFMAFNLKLELVTSLAVFETRMFYSSQLIANSCVGQAFIDVNLCLLESTEDSKSVASLGHCQLIS